MSNIWNKRLPWIIAPFLCEKRNNRRRLSFEEIRSLWQVAKILTGNRQIVWNLTDNWRTRPEGDGLLEFHQHAPMNVRCNLVQHRCYTVAQILDLDDLYLLKLSNTLKSPIVGTWLYWSLHWSRAGTGYEARNRFIRFIRLVFNRRRSRGARKCVGARGSFCSVNCFLER